MSDRQINKSRWIGGGLLLVWIAIGIILRLANLGDKSASSIEISTLGFSLGHGFLGIPLDRVISLETLLSPLQFDRTTSPADVIHHLMSESNHPPLYFVLSHLWLKLFSPDSELASLGIGRSLSAILGAASIPAIFGLGWIAFRSRVVAQIAAALMAVSPYGIYLAQEARHYTLSILWIIASLACLVVGMGHIVRRTSPPIWLVCVWIVINSLAIATHYFFSLVLCAEGLVILGFWLKDFQKFRRQKAGSSENISYSSTPRASHPSPSPLTENKRSNLLIFLSSPWRRIYAVGLGTAIGCLVWLPASQNVAQGELTDWIQTDVDWGNFWEPIVRLLAWWITMLFLLPVERTPLFVTILSGLAVLGVLVWGFPKIVRGVKIQMESPSSRLSLCILGGFLIGAIVLVFLIIYGYGKDLSKAARYHFVYFPAVIIIVASALAVYWHSSLPFDRSLAIAKDAPPAIVSGTAWQTAKTKNKKLVAIILFMGFLGALTVVSNYGYQKSQRADILTSQIQQRSQVPVLVAMSYESHAEIRASIALGLEFKRLERNSDSESTPLNSPDFVLVRRYQGDTEVTLATLKNILDRLPRPFDLWAVNLKIGDNDLEAFGCDRDNRDLPSDGYRSWLSHCL